jgi:hypothetical protein
MALCGHKHGPIVSGGRFTRPSSPRAHPEVLSPLVDADHRHRLHAAAAASRPAMGAIEDEVSRRLTQTRRPSAGAKRGP